MTIPKVRRWIVNYWKDGKCVRTQVVETINKRFAKWLANEHSRYWGSYPDNCDKITVSLSKYQKGQP